MDYARLTWGPSVGRLMMATATVVALTAGLATPTLADTPKRGGTLKVSLQLTSGSLDPLFGNGADGYFQNIFAERLISQNEKYEFEPWLAESWEASHDSRSYTFKLRQGIKFHDGEPLNAEAVKFNLDRLMDISLGHTKQASGGMLSSVEVIDEYTVRVNFKEPSELSLVMLANVEGGICSPKAIKEKGQDFARQPVCTGPFVMESWTGNEYVAKKNPNYWRTGEDGQPLPYLDGVEINIQSNSAVRMVELRSGNVQFIDYVLPKDFDTIANDPSLQLIETRKGMHEYTAFNVSKPPFDNIELRKAVALGVNREALVKVIAPGHGSVLRYMESPEQLWLYDDAVKGHVYDPEAARAAVEKSGFKGEVSMMVIQRDPDIQVAQMMQGMLSEIGINSKIEVVERQGFLDKMNALQHDFLIARMEHSIDPDSQYTSFFHERGVFNVTGTDRTETTKLVDAARNSLDRDERKKYYGQVMDKILDNYIFSWLMRMPYKAAASNRLHNVVLDAGSQLRYTDMWLD